MLIKLQLNIQIYACGLYIAPERSAHKQDAEAESVGISSPMRLLLSKKSGKTNGGLSSATSVFQFKITYYRALLPLAPESSVSHSSLLDAPSKGNKMARLSFPFNNLDPREILSSTAVIMSSKPCDPFFSAASHSQGTDASHFGLVCGNDGARSPSTHR